MLEYWNVGIVGFGKMEKWVIDKIHIDNDLDNEGIIFINNVITGLEQSQNHRFK